MSLSYEQEDRIRQEERVRENERRAIRREEEIAAARAEREYEELERLREVKDTHGYWAAFLMRSLNTLVWGGVVAIMVFVGHLSNDEGTFFVNLWKGIQGVFGVGVITFVIALWKCRKI